MCPGSVLRFSDVLVFAKEQGKKEADTPVIFEELGQGYGYVLYSGHFNQPLSGTLEIPGLRNFATVYVDGEKIGMLNRNAKTDSLEVEISFISTLDILMENMGRINYGAEIVHNTKRIVSPVKIANHEITGGWEMYKRQVIYMPVLIFCMSGEKKGKRTGLYF